MWPIAVFCAKPAIRGDGRSDRDLVDLDSLRRRRTRHAATGHGVPHPGYLAAVVGGADRKANSDGTGDISSASHRV